MRRSLCTGLEIHHTDGYVPTDGAWETYCYCHCPDATLHETRCPIMANELEQVEVCLSALETHEMERSKSYQEVLECSDLQCVSK